MRNTRKFRAIIRSALERELTKMQDNDSPHIAAGWTGSALASWIQRGVIEDIEDYLDAISSPSKRKDSYT